MANTLLIGLGQAVQQAGGGRVGVGQTPTGSGIAGQVQMVRVGDLLSKVWGGDWLDKFTIDKEKEPTGIRFLFREKRREGVAEEPKTRFRIEPVVGGSNRYRLVAARADGTDEVLLEGLVFDPKQNRFLMQPLVGDAERQVSEKLQALWKEWSTPSVQTSPTGEGGVQTEPPAEKKESTDEPSPIRIRYQPRRRESSPESQPNASRTNWVEMLLPVLMMSMLSRGRGSGETTREFPDVFVI